MTPTKSHLIFEAISRRGSEDLLAFAVTLLITGWVATAHPDSWVALAIPLIFLPGWIAIRLILLKARNEDRLLEMQRSAMIRAKDIIETEASPDEKNRLSRMGTIREIP